MATKKEILNINYHIERYTIEALMRTKTIPEAANLLKVSERSVFRYMVRYEINYEEIKRARELRKT
tara:strand:+ start:2804 stop:3001 length:198 start_codon:yes stop_codon:yes gene_type:complete